MSNPDLYVQLVTSGLNQSENQSLLEVVVSLLKVTEKSYKVDIVPLYEYGGPISVEGNLGLGMSDPSILDGLMFEGEDE